MFYKSFGKNYGNTYYEPTIMVHDMWGPHSMDYEESLKLTILSSYM